MKKLIVLCAALLLTASVQAVSLPADGDAWTETADDINTGWAAHVAGKWATYVGALPANCYTRYELVFSGASSVGDNSIVYHMDPGPAECRAIFRLSETVDTDTWTSLHMYLKTDSAATTWRLVAMSGACGITILSGLTAPTAAWAEYVIDLAPGQTIDYIGIYANPMSLPEEFWVDGFHFERPNVGTIVTLK
jgi:hypothetical protein